MPINWRRDPFTGQDQSVLRTDRHTVPANSPFYVPLLEIPRQDSPSSLVVKGAGTSVDQDASEDSYVYEGNPTTNYGPSGILVTGRDGIGAFYKYRGLMKVDLSAFTGPVDRALLWVYNLTVGSSGFPNANEIGAHAISATWAAGTVTWNSQPAHNPVAAATVTLYGEGWYAMDITALVNAWLAGTTPNHGILLKHTNEISVTDSTRNMSSLEGSQNPHLQLTLPGDSYQEVSVGTAPGPGEVAFNYEQAWARFHDSAASEAVDITMWGTGSPIDGDDAGDISKIIGSGVNGSLEVLTGTTSLAPGIYSYSSLRVAPGAVLTCNGGGPLIIGVTGDATIEGTVDLDGKGYAGGAAGFRGQGFGGLGGGAGGSSSGGGGGGSSAAGTNGGGSAPGAGGDAHPSRSGLLWPWSPPLCGGGGGGATAAAGGAGGGTLLLQVRGTLTVRSTAVLQARGAAAGGTNAGGGGGGVFWLRAPVRAVDATPTVTGGAGNGSGGAGAAGWWTQEGL